MENLKHLIKTRRSIRRFKNRNVSRKILLKIIEAGINAPSGLNNQPWKFQTVTEAGLKKTISGFTLSRYSKIICEAPALILVYLDERKIYDRDKDIMSAGACIENMLLYIHSEKMGAVWLGEILNRKKQLQKKINRQKGLELAAVIAVGYPGEKPRYPGRRKLSSFLLEG
ncbi:MAG: nitroreductase family protein [Candidatus Aureabacteria bacterium]|nr:nitroreductase family protein [Candidatus Auribacterota bacterium]